MAGQCPCLMLVVLTVFRLVELTCLHGMITDHGASVVTAFVKGVWFDNVVACYISVLPLAVTLLAAAFGYAGKKLRKGVCYLVFRVLSHRVHGIGGKHTVF